MKNKHSKLLSNTFKATVAIRQRDSNGEDDSLAFEKIGKPLTDLLDAEGKPLNSSKADSKGVSYSKKSSSSILPFYPSGTKLFPDQNFELAEPVPSSYEEITCERLSKYMRHLEQMRINLHNLWDRPMVGMKKIVSRCRENKLAAESSPSSPDVQAALKKRKSLKTAALSGEKRIITRRHATSVSHLRQPIRIKSVENMDSIFAMEGLSSRCAAILPKLHYRGQKNGAFTPQKKQSRHASAATLRINNRPNQIQERCVTNVLASRIKSPSAQNVGVVIKGHVRPATRTSTQLVREGR